MSELATFHYETRDDARYYREGVHPWLARREIYRYSRRPGNFYDEAFKRIPILSHGSARTSVLDIGCGDGRDIARLRRPPYNFPGSITALDLFKENFFTWQTAETAGFAPIEFMVGNAHDLRLPSNSQDVTFAELVFHHANDPLWALREAHRVTKRGGLVAIVTPGADNPEHGNPRKPRHAKAYRQLAERFGTTPPPSHTDKFDDAVAREHIPRIFGDRFRRIEFNDVLEIPPDEGWIDFFYSLSSLKPDFGRLLTGEEWLTGINEIVKPEFDEIVASRGCFDETVSHSLYLCWKG